MRSITRTFTVTELNKPVAAIDIRLAASEQVEIIDRVTQVTSRMSAADVSMYRHTLSWQGKKFNILNIWE